MEYTINLNVNYHFGENDTTTENFTNNNEYLIKKIYTFLNNEYTIIKYNKEKLKELEKLKYDNIELTELFYELSKFRSVVVRNNKVVVYSPAKSVDYDTFKAENPNESECWSEDFVDGTMINVFYDNINESWEIATKSTVGGNILFFNDIKNYEDLKKSTSNPSNQENTDNIEYENSHNDEHEIELEYQVQKYNTFRSMFFEACNANNFNLNSLDKRYCYVFVLQHPFNRIVTPVVLPVIFLIKIYEINNDNFPQVQITDINIPNLATTPPYIFLNTGVQFLNRYPITKYSDIENHYSSENTPYYCVGCMIYNMNGVRTKIRNNNYEKVRKLRGNQPKLQYNYLCLKQENKIQDFLYYYPEHFVLFKKFKLLLFTYTNELFMNYISCFIRKEKPLKEYDFQFKTHMYNLHDIYKKDLKPNGKYIDKKFVIDYVNTLHPSQQMFVINYKHHPEKNTENSEKVESYCEIECVE